MSLFSAFRAPGSRYRYLLAVLHCPLSKNVPHYSPRDIRFTNNTMDSKAQTRGVDTSVHRLNRSLPNPSNRHPSSTFHLQLHSRPADLIKGNDIKKEFAYFLQPATVSSRIHTSPVVLMTTQRQPPHRKSNQPPATPEGCLHSYSTQNPLRHSAVTC